MTILNIFLNENQRANRGHFANIVKIAKVDGKLTRREIVLLKKIKRDLGISDIIFRSIVRHPERYPINPPTNYEDRITRLHTLAKMLIVEKESYELSLKLLEKLAVGIGFPLKTHKEVVKLAVKLVMSHTDVSTFAAEIKKINIHKD
jgi:hypothetical protein